MERVFKTYQVPSRALGNKDVTQVSRDVLTFLWGGGAIWSALGFLADDVSSIL